MMVAVKIKLKPEFITETTEVSEKVFGLPSYSFLEDDIMDTFYQSIPDDISWFDAVEIESIDGVETLSEHIIIEDFDDLDRLNEFLEEYIECNDLSENLYIAVANIGGDLYELDEMFNMNELDDLLSDKAPSEIMAMAHNGKFNPNDEYFRFNGYGNLESYSDYDRDSLIDDYASDFWNQLWSNY